jgi:Protein of unknown function (DUF3224)
MNGWQDVSVQPDESFARRLESELVAELFADRIGRAEPSARWTRAVTRHRTNEHHHQEDMQEDMMVIELDEPVQETKPRAARWLAVAAVALLAVGAGGVIVSQRDDAGTAGAPHEVNFEVQWPSLRATGTNRCNGTTQFESVGSGTCLRAWSGEAEFRGDIDGTSLWDMVANYGEEPGPDGAPVDTPATFSATYLVAGTVEGCGSGEFMMAEVTRFVGWSSGQFPGTWQVLPGSGRGDLLGLSGSGEIQPTSEAAPEITPHRYTGSLTCG